ncbi:MAG: hypothetical protein KC416_15135 [Myxococcales bacterium]|nr:hypothetical protein [Myxococcales bacterium]
MIGVVGVAVLAHALTACGPSLRRVHTSDQYFELCNTAHADESYSQEDRAACWRAWIKHYGSFQPPEQVEYALDRLEVLEGRTAPTPVKTPKLPQGALPGSEQNVDKPTQPSEPPMEDEAGTSACASYCHQEWRSCLARCERNATPCQAACQMTQQTCRGGCPP